MEYTEFVKKYDCQIQYQYAYDGKKKNYYPIISNLRLSNEKISLAEFDKYPKIDFYNCVFKNIEFSTKKIRDLNFQNCVVSDLEFDFEEITGTLGFANSDISLTRMITKSCPKILAFVECVIFGMKDPNLIGFNNLHTCAIIQSNLDYLHLDNFLDSLKCEQLLLNGIESDIPLTFSVPYFLKSLKLKNLYLESFPMIERSVLEKLHLEEIRIVSVNEFFELLNKLTELKELAIITSNLRFLPDLTLDNLEKLQLDFDIEIDNKLLARLKLGDIEFHRV